jgi:hypothetical protein
LEGEIEKRHAVDTIWIVLWVMSIVGVVVIKRCFPISERMLIFVAQRIHRILSLALNPLLAGYGTKLGRLITL